MKKSTRNLYETMQSSKNYEDFYEKEKAELIFDSLKQYLDTMMVQKGVTKTQLIERSNIEKGYAYQILRGEKKNPSRDKCLMLAFGLGLNLQETQKLLHIANVNELYIRVIRDSVIIFCIEKGMTLMQANEKLYEYGSDPIE